jgi:putative ABC transport system permease protein
MRTSVLSALNRKLLRDLWAMRGQALAIAAVVAAGVAIYVMYRSNFDSLERTRAAYYESGRLADVFASVGRAPAAVRERIAAIPGVEVVDTRIVQDVVIDVPGVAEPATGRLISLPGQRRPALNDVYLRRGRWIDPTRRHEVLASEMFCVQHGLEPGDRIAAIINGRRQTLTIAGIALSPEYIYAIRPGDLVPDFKRFGVFWIDERGLASAFDLDGAFNDVSLRLTRGASRPDVLAAVDRRLEPFGGHGAQPRELVPSPWVLDNELKQLQTFGFLVPAIFLGVAVFILHVALTRALTLQRPQIAALKALGYSTRALTWHYTKWALAVALAGAAAGIAAGAPLGALLTGLYNGFFRFPALAFHLSPAVVLQALLGSLGVAALGAQAAVRMAVRVPPAESMRPEAPARYRRSPLERRWKPLRLAVPARMVLRNLERQPLRTALAVLGIAFAVAVLLVGLAFVDVMHVLIDEQLTQTMRQDATVTFAQPRPPRVGYDVRHLPGVQEVELTRVVPVRVRAGNRSRTVALTGLPRSSQLNRIVDDRGTVFDVPSEGVTISARLGEVLGVQAGDPIQVELLTGRRRVLDLPVVAMVHDSLGLNVYTALESMHRVVGDAVAVTGAAVTMDPAAQERFYAQVKAMPAIASVAMREAIRQNFRDTMAQNMNVSIGINVVFAMIIALGVVYNSARVSLSERAHELASLRVLGFTRAEISMILLGELAILTALALPVGTVIGVLFGQLITESLNSEVYRMTFVVEPATVARSCLAIVAAAALSGVLVRRRLDQLDLIAVLKVRE